MPIYALGPFHLDTKDDLLLRGAGSIRRRQVLVEQGAKLWELRVAVSLARLRRSQGCSAEARDLPAPAHNWFTEGFDTPDLKAAKALLDALR